MIVPKRVPLSRLTANALEKEILNKRWEVRLPGYRSLCKELQVSRKTLVTALEILTRRKLLLPPNATCARIINPNLITRGPNEPSRKRRNLTIVTNSKYLEYDEKKTQLFDRLQSSFQAKGWLCNRVDTEEINEQPKAQLHNLYKENPEARWLIENPSYDAIKWCVKNNIRAIAYGGATGRIKLPCVGRSLSDLLAQAHHYLHSIGHRRIVCLIDRPSKSSIQKYAQYLRSNNIIFRENYHIPNIDRITAETFQKMLKNLFSVTPPTAIVTSSKKQLIALLGFCLQRSIKIPGDLSIILASDLPHTDWFSPGLSYYNCNREREAQVLSSYIEHYPTSIGPPLTIPSKLIDKGSILPL